MHDNVHAAYADADGRVLDYWEEGQMSSGSEQEDSDEELLFPEWHHH